MKRAVFVLVVATCAAMGAAQSLEWKPNRDHRSYSAIYGQITVLLDGSETYYCGADWWASNPAAGSTGIQTAEKGRKTVMFSIWPTDKGDNAFPRLAQTNPHLRYALARNDVHGSHCDAEYAWPEAQTYQFYATKRLDERSGGIVVSMYFYDEAKRAWVGSGRILSPVDGKKTIDTFDHLTSSVINLRKKTDPDRDRPRLAVFRLWAGSGPGDLSMITVAGGKGEWGTVNGFFYLGIGSSFEVDQALLKTAAGSKIEPGRNKKDRLEVAAELVPQDVVRALQDLN